MTDLKIAQENLQHAQAIVDNLKAQLEDPFKDLKKAYSEGAIIEYIPYLSCVKWEKICNPSFNSDIKMYRIKDNVSIDSWNAHKDLIKQWWDGAEIEYKLEAFWKYCGVTPNWYASSKYRVKQDKWKLLEYENGSEWVIATAYNTPQKIRAKYLTKIGRRRATKELAVRCAKASKTRDLLEAHRDNIDPEYIEPDWNNVNENKYYITLNKGIYYTDYNFNSQTIGCVYMSKDTAEQIVDALNAKKIIL